ncbi:hypothetical protein LTR29_016673 [Friedmanniomyces endolithicus]|uniref:Uncharacterized protein n=1 Tax=Friedmanniomyces endolithicus TaxID=329885 RepID=A0A4U0V303_9PEZI|nr:hypothetical protein LTR29_016673 [Friedmanniomyces endolithicus]TKA42612.1 hypothetical protein B0A54_07454 [Friedmanniomyces endolithicus]
MILSTYRNPPYRTPTPKGKSLSLPPPAPAPSPKRKRRIDSQSAGPGLGADSTLQINSAVDVTDNIPENLAESPHTRIVVERLRDLDISQEPQSEAGRDLSESPRKRLKRNREVRAPDIDVNDVNANIYSSPESSSQPLPDHGNDRPLEISETPDWRRVRLPSSPPIPELDTQPPAQNPDAATVLKTKPIKSTRFLSPPPRSPPSPDPSPTAQTWHPSEITGQTLDPTTPDDDGEGINGIGFRPTPAIAYARSQRRKQQVSAWKAREAGEARQRRVERRRGGSGSGSIGEGKGGRCVRFDGVG